MKAQDVVEQINKHWNRSIMTYMKQYIYVRQLKKGKKPSFINKFVTLMYSASWHGLDIEYFNVFLTISFITEMGTDLKKFAPFFKRIIPYPLIQNAFKFYFTVLVYLNAIQFIKIHNKKTMTLNSLR